MSQKIELITIKELINFNQEKNGILIDARPVDAYNGWKLQGESRGGHIKGAKSLPFKWTKYIDWIEIVRSKGILPDKQIIVYSYSSKEAEAVAQLFIRAGYQNVGIYNHFIAEWTVSLELPIERLERYAHLVYPEWVKSILSGDNPPEYIGEDVIICHAHYRNLDHTTREYHEIEDIWKKAGITPDKHLAFYCGTGWRGSEAFFNAWLLGWPRVSVFDGGWFEWSNDPENPFETGIPRNI